MSTLYTASKARELTRMEVREKSHKELEKFISSLEGCRIIEQINQAISEGKYNVTVYQLTNTGVNALRFIGYIVEPEQATDQYNISWY